MSFVLQTNVILGHYEAESFSETMSTLLSLHNCGLAPRERSVLQSVELPELARASTGGRDAARCVAGLRCVEHAVGARSRKCCSQALRSAADSKGSCFSWCNLSIMPRIQRGRHHGWNRPRSYVSAIPFSSGGRMALVIRQGHRRCLQSNIRLARNVGGPRLRGLRDSRLSTSSSAMFSGFAPCVTASPWRSLPASLPLPPFVKPQNPLDRPSTPLVLLQHSAAFSAAFSAAAAAACRASLRCSWGLQYQVGRRAAAESRHELFL
jgi:hypothetical protein